MSFERLEIELPPSIFINGRHRYRKSEIDAIKVKLMSRGLKRAEPKIAPVDPKDDQLIPASQVMRDLAIPKRSFYRYLKEANDRAAGVKPKPKGRPGRKPKGA